MFYTEHIRCGVCNKKLDAIERLLSESFTKRLCQTCCRFKWVQIKRSLAEKVVKKMSNQVKLVTNYSPEDYEFVCNALLAKKPEGNISESDFATRFNEALKEIRRRGEILLRIEEMKVSLGVDVLDHGSMLTAINEGKFPFKAEEKEAAEKYYELYLKPKRGRRKKLQENEAQEK